jgi:glucosyl-dolichyl phosphate glucuronosyltransferase
MNISVIVCTYNRCRILTRTLNSVAVQQLPSEVEWEILVVDNNSSDRTRQVVEEVATRHPNRFRYVFEPRQGLSHARNAGIRESQGEILAFTDDDVTVVPNWLRNLTGSLNNGKWAGAGGRILAADHFTPPEWLVLDGPYDLGGPLFGHFDFGDAPRALEQPPFGGNMAYQKSIFEKYGVFRTDLGRNPADLVGFEDTEFGCRLMRAGVQLRYEPHAIAYHPIDKSRLQKPFFLNWWFDYGRAEVREGPNLPPIFGIPRPLVRIMILSAVEMPKRILRWILESEPKGKFYYKCRVRVTAGQIKEKYRMLRMGSSPEKPQSPASQSSD